jgi:xanthine dehydrogenase YagS FAD-binding subunit
MQPFQFSRAGDVGAATKAGGQGAVYLSGGTTLLDLMKLDVLRPAKLVDIGALRDKAQIKADAKELRLSAFSRMADAQANEVIRRDYPVIAQSLQLAASQQIRNMASLGGNVLQATRCTYYRDTSYSACNKRAPGSGCAALQGAMRNHAVLGVSDKCIAAYPGDFAQALIALDAIVEMRGPRGVRALPFAELHKPPGDTPHIETSLSPGELITDFVIPAGPWTRRSLYLKIRDRESFEFAIASAAVALHKEGGVIRAARIGLGGVATTPWRAKQAEAVLIGKPLTEQTAQAAAEAAFAGARTREHNRYKPDLGRRTLVRALLQANAMEA